MPFLRTSAVAATAATVGLAAGVGAYTFGYARGASYLTDDPRACANCHVMEEQLAAWTKSSHRAVAVCNDCHTPPGLVPKYFTKALNGWHHSVAFTTGDFPDPIRITPRNRAVTEQACRKCHAPIVAAIDAAAAIERTSDAAAAIGSTSGAHARGAADRLACLACHRDVGHLH